MRIVNDRLVSVNKVWDQSGLVCKADTAVWRQTVTVLNRKVSSYCYLNLLTIQRQTAVTAHLKSKPLL